MRSIKLYAGIDYDFRPESYWAPAGNPLAAALRNVKGRNRREMIRDYHSSGLLPTLSDDLLRDTLEEDTRESLGLIHPSFMGGETCRTIAATRSRSPESNYNPQLAT
jgi:hypothetical protein